MQKSTSPTGGGKIRSILRPFAVRSFRASFVKGGRRDSRRRRRPSDRITMTSRSSMPGFAVDGVRRSSRPHRGRGGRRAGEVIAGKEAAPTCQTVAQGKGRRRTLPPPHAAVLRSPAQANASEERGSAFIHHLSPPSHFCLCVCLSCWRQLHASQ
jgi:hypothetical protein